MGLLNDSRDNATLWRSERGLRSDAQRVMSYRVVKDHVDLIIRVGTRAKLKRELNPINVNVKTMNQEIHQRAEILT